MLRVFCYLDPWGDIDHRKELFEVQIINDGTGSIEEGNYHIHYLKDGEEYGKADIKSYPRELGAGKLVYEAMKILMEEQI